jgi:hypothetical protein
MFYKLHARRPRVFLGAVAFAVALAPSPGQADFGAPITLSPTGKDALLPQVAVAASGPALVVWHGSGPPVRILARTRSAAGVFGPIRTLSVGSLDAFNPRVAIDADGDALVVWERHNLGVPQLQARTFSRTGALGPLLTISGTNAQDARVAVDSDGDALMVWERFDGTVFRIQGRALSRTGALGAIQTLSLAGADSTDPRVAIDADGDALVVWERDDPSGDRIEGRARSKAGVLGPVLNVAASNRHARDPQVAVDSDGDAYVVWERPVPPSEQPRIQGRARTRGGLLRPIVNLSPDGAAASGSQVAIDTDGDALVVWQRAVGSLRIEARSRARTGVLGPVKTLSSMTIGIASGPRVAIDANGDGVIAWERSNAGAVVIQARARSRTGTLAPLDTLSAAGATQAEVGIDADGNALVVWRRHDGSNHRVQSAAGP